MGGDADSDFTQSQEGSVLSLLYAAQALVGFTILLEVLTLAYDGLMRRVRFEYESLIDGVPPSPRSLV